MIKDKVSIFSASNSESHGSHDNKDTILFLGSINVSIPVISTKTLFC